MSTMTDIRRRGSRRNPAAQGGFALLAALAIMAFATLVVLATMTYNLVSVRIANEQTASTQAQRAAESGMNTAIQFLRNASPDTPPNPGDPVDRTTLEGKYEEDAGQPSGVAIDMPPCLGSAAGVTEDSAVFSIDGEQVTITCTPQEAPTKERRVALRATVGSGANTSLRATSTIRIVDADESGADSFGRFDQIESWRLCSASASSTVCA